MYLASNWCVKYCTGQYVTVCFPFLFYPSTTKSKSKSKPLGRHGASPIMLPLAAYLTLWLASCTTYVN